MVQLSDMGAWGEDALALFWDRVGLYQGEGHTVGMHVRQGDKVGEMVMHPFADHMGLASRIRMRFPTARSIWLVTEMEVGVSLVCPGCTPLCGLSIWLVTDVGVRVPWVYSSCTPRVPL